MFRITKILLVLSVGSFLSLSNLLIGSAYAAASASMYLSPASSSVANGGTLTLDIHENSGSTSIYTARAVLTYPASRLSLVDFTPGAAFDFTPPQPSQTSGTARYDAGACNSDPATGKCQGLTGDQVIATVRFKALVGSGSAAISVNPANQSNPTDYSKSAVNTIVSNGTTVNTVNILSSVTGGSYTLTGDAAVNPTTSGSSSSGSSSSSSSGGSSKNGSKTTTPSSGSSSTTSNAKLTISDIKLSDLSGKSATISWQTSAAASSEIDYGLSTRYGFSAVDAKLVTNHSLKLNPNYMTGGITYHFVIKSIDANNNSAASPDMTFGTLTAGANSKNSSLNTSTLLLVTGASLAGFLVLAMGAIYYMRRRGAQAEIDRHFPNLPTAGNATASTKPGGTVTPTTPTVQPPGVTPGSTKKGP